LSKFSLRFVYKNPVMAQRVAEDLLSRFIAVERPWPDPFRLRVLDAPSVPQTPIAPGRLLLAVGGLAAGIALGISAVFLRRPYKPA
jgi:capsular polysaccharide biosynthesis protein